MQACRRQGSKLKLSSMSASGLRNAEGRSRGSGKPQSNYLPAQVARRRMLSIVFKCPCWNAWCGLFQKASRADDASLRSLSELLDDAQTRLDVVASRNSWYAHLEHRDHLIEADKKCAEAKIDRFRKRLDEYK